MSQRNLLPRLLNAKVADAPVSEWTPITNAAELSRLHHGDGDDKVLRTRVRSIPNPWARMLLFRAALQQDDHPARALVENELLDALQFLFTLSHRPRVAFRAERVSLDSPAALAGRAATERIEQFSRALIDLAPRRGDGTPFSSITVGLINNQSVLASSPFTVVFSTEDAASQPSGATGGLFSFLKTGRATPIERRPPAFQQYLAQVLLPQLQDPAALTAAGGDGEWMVKHLGKWVQSLVERAARAASGSRVSELASPTGERVWEKVAARLGCEAIPEFAAGAQLYRERVEPSMRASRWVLRTTRANAPKAPLILDALRFDGTLFPGAQRVELAVDYHKGDREQLPEVGTQYPWRDPARHWFTDQLVVFEEALDHDKVYGYRQIGYSSGGDGSGLRTVNFALPLRAEVLSYFTPEELDERLNITVAPGGRVTVGLRIPLGVDGNEHELEVKREYTENDVAIWHGPGLALWPRFRSPRSKHHAVFRYDHERALAAEVGVALLEGSGALDAQFVRRTESVSILTSAQAPEGIEFSLTTTPSQPIPLGILLPRYVPPRFLEVDAIRRIGVDFGTSNTVVSWEAEAGQFPELLSTQELVLSLHKSAKAVSDAMESLFFPAAIEPAPFGTAAVYHGTSDQQASATDPIALRLSIPFLGHVIDDANHRVAGDLKWSVQAHRHALTEAFLRHLLAVVSAEALGRGVDPAKLEVVWAYPRSFSLTQRNLVEGLWEKVCQDVLGAKPPTRLDESAAVLRFFFNQLAFGTADRPKVIVDVGGGTSDIAIYGYDRAMVLDSALLGGRDLTGSAEQSGTLDNSRNPFVKELAAWATANGLAGHKRTADAVNKYVSQGQDHLAFSYLIQSDWFRQHGLRFLGSETAQTFEGMVLYLFGAICFYVGLSMRAEAARTGSEVELPTDIVFAGNGSKYLKWLVQLREGPLEPFARELGRLVAVGAGVDASRGREISIGLTTDPKREVAFGLIQKIHPHTEATASTREDPLCGEAVRTSKVPSEGRALSPDQALTSATPLEAGKLEWTAPQLEIERFHAALLEGMQSLAREGGSHWSNQQRRFHGVFAEVGRAGLEGLARQRLQFLTLKHGGFNGSLFMVEVSAMLQRLQRSLF